MRILFDKRAVRLPSVIVAAALALASGTALAQKMSVTLSGDNEVPPVQTKASGEGTITVADDHTMSGKVMTKGIEATAAHIHVGAAGENGPVAIPLEKGEGGAWSVPAGTKLTDDQHEALEDGKLYVNVHSAAHPGGELRGQLKP